MTLRPFRIILIASEGCLLRKREKISQAITRMSVAFLRIYLNFNKRSESIWYFLKIRLNSFPLEDDVLHE